MEKYDIIKASDLQDTLGDLQSTIGSLQTALNGKSNTGHTHTISQVSNLQSTLDEKLSWNRRVYLQEYIVPSTNASSPSSFYLLEKGIGELSVGISTYRANSTDGKANHLTLYAPTSGSLYFIMLRSEEDSFQEWNFYPGSSKLRAMTVYSSQPKTIEFMCLRLK